MPFTQYKTIADVLAEFPMTYQETSFLEHHALAIDPSFVDRLQLVLTEGMVFNSEYAICENIISPILTEVWRSYVGELLIWSHQPLRYSDQLSGTPDYVVARRSPRGKVLFEQPYLILIEAKRDDFEAGWGQCLAELWAAQQLNQEGDRPLFGIVSNGKLWEFGRLWGETFTKHPTGYTLDRLSELMGAIDWIFATSAQPTDKSFAPNN